MKPPLATVLTLALAACFVMWVLGCAAKNTTTAAPTAEPAPAVAAAVQQAGAVNTQATGFNYASGFGIGATACVGLSLVLTLLLSHRREMARIERGRA